MQSIVVSY